jgi:hypothetical protein
MRRDPTTFGQLPIGARFVMADSTGGAVKVKTGYGRWKWEGHRGFLPVAVGCRPEREVVQLEDTRCNVAVIRPRSPMTP